MDELKEKRVAIVFEGHEPQRLDRFLSDSLAQHSRSYLQKLIADGLVRVNGKTVKASRTLHGGETVEAVLPPPKPLAAEPEPIALKVIYEDEHLIAVDKPPGMVVHPAPGHSGGTLVNALLAHCKDLSGIGGALRPGIVHRLDVGTSGVIVAAKSDAAHRSLARQFKERTVGKVYRAVVFGSPNPAAGEINIPIGRDRRNRKKISAATDNPREAVTRYEIVEDFGDFSHLSLRLLTGRTHQVRVHLTHIGHPVVGDTLYAEARRRGIADPRRRALAGGFPRPALHAYSLYLRHPLSGEELALLAPLPDDILELLENLGGGS